jgi:anti-sigma B factor antagonist
MEAESSGERGPAERIRPAGSVPDFSLSLERPANGTRVLVLAGELDLYRAPEIEEAIAEAVGGEGGDRDGERCRLVVDLRAVTFVDSTMLGLLLAASRRERARGEELRILVGPKTPMTAFVVTGVDRLLAIRLVDNGSSESSTRSGETAEGAAETTAIT